jgi:hypothetical protein
VSLVGAGVLVRGNCVSSKTTWGVT